LILALSTTTAQASLALGDSETASVAVFESRRELARTLMWRIDRLVTERGARRKDVSKIAVDAGPGSFTGTRIGVSTARALGEALHVPVVAMSSVDILMRQAVGLDRDLVEGRRVLAAVESKSDEMFAAVYDACASRMLGPLPVRYADALAFAAGYRGALAVGAPWRGDKVSPDLADLIDLAPTEWDYPNAATLLPIARGARGNPARDVVPLYVRVSQPEAKAGEGPRAWRPPAARIRHMGPEDLDAVIALEQKSFLTPWPKDAIVEDFARSPSSTYLIAESPGGQVVGYVALWVIHQRGHVASIAVEPAFRGQGIAKRLMLEVFEECRRRGLARVTLEYRASNTAAEHLYEGLGFRKEGLRRRYYTDTGEDAVVVGISLRDRAVLDLHREVRARIEEEPNADPGH